MASLCIVLFLFVETTQEERIDYLEKFSKEKVEELADANKEIARLQQELQDTRSNRNMWEERSEKKTKDFAKLKDFTRELEAEIENQREQLRKARKENDKLQDLRDKLLEEVWSTANTSAPPSPHTQRFQHPRLIRVM